MKWHIIAIAAATASTASLAHAQDSPPVAQETGESATACNYERSVSPEREARASELTDLAFAAHSKLDYDEAAALYKRALEQWDRPDIHHRAGMAYYYAAKLMEAYYHLIEALRCGREWIDPANYEEARILMQRLGPWFGEVEVRVPEPKGAEPASVETTGAFDDESWFKSAGTHRRVVVAGQHVVKVERPGHIPVEKLVFVSPGERVVVAPRLIPEDRATVYARRWRRWKPWVVAGAGAGVALVGGGFQWLAYNQLGEYDQALFDLCQGANGCKTDEQAALQAAYDAATLKNRLAVGAFVAGGVVLAAGAALIFLNRPRARRHPDAGGADVEVLPMVTPKRAGLAVNYRF